MSSLVSERKLRRAQSSVLFRNPCAILYNCVLDTPSRLLHYVTVGYSLPNVTVKAKSPVVVCVGTAAAPLALCVRGFMVYMSFVGSFSACYFCPILCSQMVIACCSAFPMAPRGPSQWQCSTLNVRRKVMLSVSSSAYRPRLTSPRSGQGRHASLRVSFSCSSVATLFPFSSCRFFPSLSYARAFFLYLWSSVGYKMLLFNVSHLFNEEWNVCIVSDLLLSKSTFSRVW